MTVTRYANPDAGIYGSARFALATNGVATDVFAVKREALVYLENYWNAGDQVAAHFVTFAADERVTCVLQFLLDSITTVDIYPKWHRIAYTIAGDTVTFSLAPKQTAWVVVNGELGEPCKVRCCTPIATPAIGGSVVLFNGSQTSVAADTTLVMPAGVNTIGQGFVVHDGGRIFLVGGSWNIGSLTISNENDQTIEGHGVLSGEWSSPEAVALLSTFDEKLTYSMIYSLESDFQHSGTTVRGITIVNPPFYSIFGANSAIEVLSIGFWAPNCDGFHLAADTDAANIATAHDNVIWSCDDCLNVSEWIGGFDVQRNLLASVAAATFLGGYWPGVNYGLGASLVDNTVISQQEWGDGNGVLVQMWSDGEEDEDSQVIADFDFDGLHIEGPNYRAMPFYIDNVLYPWGTQGDGRGRISHIWFRNVTIETTPRLRSIIAGRDSVNTPSDIHFENLTIGGVRVSVRNFAQFFDVGEEVYNCTIDGASFVA